MGAPDIGIKKWLQFALESAYGTDTAATHRIPILDFGFTPDAGLVDDSTQDGANVNEPAPIQTIESCSGFIETYLDFENQLLLIDCAFGTATYGVKGGVDAGAGPYTHTYIDSRLLFNSLCLQLGEGDVPVGKCAKVLGAKVTRQTIAGEPGSPCTIRWDYVAKRKITDQTPTAGPTAGARTIASWRNITALANGSADAAGDQKIESFSYVIENPLLVGWTGASGQYPDEPVINGQRKTSLTLTQRRMTKTLEDAYLAKTALTPSLTLTSGTKVIALTIPAAYLVSAPDPTSRDFGITRQTLNYKCTNNATAYASQLVITNAEATITTP